MFNADNWRQVGVVATPQQRVQQEDVKPQTPKLGQCIEPIVPEASWYENPIVFTIAHFVILVVLYYIYKLIL